MEAILFPAIGAVVVFLVFLLLLPGRISSDEDRRKQAMLEQMSQETERANLQQRNNNVSLLKTLPAARASDILLKLPGVQSTFDLLLKSGLEQQRSVYFLGVLLLLLVSLLLLHKMGIMGILIAFAIAYFVPRKYLGFRIAKRNEQFLNLFPDAIDMIVRSVRSGHPLNTAMRMISENMENPVRDEFKQVVDEVAYGRTLPEALVRMARRIDEQDLNFFVVVLSVQQETGGSLAEVLTNLSAIIRKRRQLRLKIRAITSEGRATSYVLGALPILVFCALLYAAPGYLTPLFEKPAGHVILGVAIGLIVGAMWIVRVMVDIKI